jgi:hypothetical protein
MSEDIYLITKGQIALTVKGKNHTFQSDHKDYEWAIRALLDGTSPSEVLVRLNPMVNLPKNLPFSLQNDVVFVGKRIVPTELGKKLLACAAAGKYKPFLAFWNKLVKNPSYRSQNQLFSFLQTHNFPLTKEGDFLAYKKVREDYMDCHTGTILNKPGRVIKMDRGLISDDPQHPCATGLHCANMRYAQGFSGTRLLEISVNPMNVVSVPYDSNFEKMRVCCYKINKEITKLVEEGKYDRHTKEIV